MSRRIGVNLLWLVPGVVGGSEEYITRLLAAVAARRDHELVVFARPELAAAHPHLMDLVQPIEPPYLPPGRACRVIAENTWLPRAVRREGLAVVHHAGGTIPRRSHARTILTVHDLQPLDHPGNFSPLKRRYLATALPRSIAGADRVTAPSRWVADRIDGEFLEGERHVAVVPGGPGMLPSRPSAARIQEVREAYGIDRPFVIYPAITYGHKNHRVLIRAAGLLDGVQIVLTGGAGDAEDYVQNYIASHDLEDAVKRVGRIPAADLDVLSWDSLALVFPSEYEGFGLPVVEAMARGIPAVVAESSCLPEIIGDAGLVVPPHDVGAWAATINGLVADPAAAERLGLAGRDRAVQFSSERGAAELAAVYDEMLTP